MRGKDALLDRQAHRKRADALGDRVDVLAVITTPTVLRLLGTNTDVNAMSAELIGIDSSNEPREHTRRVRHPNSLPTARTLRPNRAIHVLR